MKGIVESEAKLRRAVVPEEAAFLDLVRTAELLSRPVAQLLRSEDLSPAQYNVLRILRGATAGLTCGEIGNRMITRDPDITRLLDRIEKRGLISRNRHDQDRRVVLTRITGEGLALLERLDEPVLDLHRRLFGHLGAERLETLRQLLEECRGAV
jgi:DNA-binding MarR family transcriptional regulator